MFANSGSKSSLVQINHNPSHRDDGGFTLVELLIVIVILGILATVTVFAVRGITDQGEDSAEAAELRLLDTGMAAYASLNSSNATEADLVAAGYLTTESELLDINVAGDDTYTITNVATGAVVRTGPAVGGGTTATTAPASGVNGWLGTPTTVGGLAAVRYGNPSGPRIVFYGGADAKTIWNDKVGSSVPSSFNMTIIDKSLLTSAAIVADAQAADGNNAYYLTGTNEPVLGFTSGAPLFVYMRMADPSLELQSVAGLSGAFL